MTEDEARQKWCPFVREVICGQSERLGSYNRFEGTQAGCNCIASDCMAWRLAEYELKDDGHEEAHGFCGLAGVMQRSMF